MVILYSPYYLSSPHLWYFHCFKNEVWWGDVGRTHCFDKNEWIRKTAQKPEKKKTNRKLASYALQVFNYCLEKIGKAIATLPFCNCSRMVTPQGPCSSLHPCKLSPKCLSFLAYHLQQNSSCYYFLSQSHT